MSMRLERPTSSTSEFERQQFLLYDSRRLAVETHANAMIASALAIAVVLVSDYARDDHPPIAWFVAGLAGLAWLLVFANIACVVWFLTPWWQGGAVGRTDAHPMWWEGRSKRSATIPRGMPHCGSKLMRTGKPAPGVRGAWDP
jgi:hypothetical protein